MAEAVVQTLSATKQRKSLGESSKKEKILKKKKPTRTTVVNPREVEWPDLDEKASKELLRQLEACIKCLKIPCRHVPLNEIRTIPKSERSEFRKKWTAENSLLVGYDISNYTLNRSALCLGVNCVSKAMEMDLVVGVIIEKDVEPEIITKLLIPIAISKGIPIVSVCGLRSVFKTVAGMRCIALGFKKECTNVAHQFYPLLRTLKEISGCDDSEANVLERETAIVANSEVISSTLMSSEVDEQGNDGVQPVISQVLSSPAVPPTFSVEEEIEKLAKKVKAQAIKREMSEKKGNAFVPPKIRRVTPK